MTTMNHIYLVDQDAQLRAQLHQLARDNEAQVFIFDDAESLLRAEALQTPACLISEFDLAGMSGLALQELLRRRGARIPMIFVAHQADTARTVRAVQQGAVNVLDKPARPNELLQAIDTALRKSKHYLRLDAQHAILRSRLDRLTVKEQQVLDLLLDGKPNKVIARRLAVSLRTVEVRRQNIFRKTETRSVAELVQLVVAVRTPPTPRAAADPPLPHFAERQPV